MSGSIFIIDDDAELGRVMQHVLEEEEYPVTVCTDLKAAREKVKKVIPRLVFLDLKMPGGNGILFLKGFRKLYPDVPVYILTGYADLQSAQDALKFGATEYLTKPIDLKKLKRIVRDALVDFAVT